MDKYNINIQFPNHHFIGQTTVNPDCLQGEFVTEKTKRIGLMTKFYIEHDKDDTDPLFKIMGECYYDSFENYLLEKSGEIWLGIPSESFYSYHFTGVWPISINWGYLDYNSDPNFDVEFTWKYNKMELCNQLIDNV